MGPFESVKPFVSDAQLDIVRPPPYECPHALSPCGRAHGLRNHSAAHAVLYNTLLSWPLNEVGPNEINKNTRPREYHRFFFLLACRGYHLRLRAGRS